MEFDGGTILSLISLAITLLLGVGVWLNSRRSNRTAEKKLTVEEQTAEDNREDVIARRRKEELERLYKRVDDLDEDMKSMKADLDARQATIDTQAIDIRDLQQHATESDEREELLFTHLADLRDHIVEGKPPPPPMMPEKLVAWFAEHQEKRLHPPA